MKQRPQWTKRDGRALADRRRRIGLSQDDLAELIPCHMSTLATWERAIYRPSPEALARIDAILAEREKALLVELIERHGIPRPA